MKILTAVLLFSVLTISIPALAVSDRLPRSEKYIPAALQNLSPQGKKNLLPGGGWFTWNFDRKPKLGTLIVKVQAFSKDGKRSVSYEITGECGMPEMRAHDSGPKKFLLNKKGDYLMPADIVMPGEWEVVIRVKKDGKEIYAGKVLFDV